MGTEVRDVYKRLRIRVVFVSINIQKGIVLVLSYFVIIKGFGELKGEGQRKAGDLCDPFRILATAYQTLAALGPFLRDCFFSQHQLVHVTLDVSTLRYLVSFLFKKNRMKLFSFFLSA